MIPDREVMAEGLTALEQEINRAGWDAPPLLAIMYSKDISRDRTALAMVPFPVQPQEIAGDDIGGVLMHMGGRMRYEGEAMNRALREHWEGFVGMLLVTEAWLNSELTPDRRDGRSLADIPGSVEVRIVFAIDTAGRAFQLTRRRGRRPEMEIFDNGDEAKVSGRVAIGLRDMTWALARALPLGSADLDRIASIAAQQRPDEPEVE